MIPGRAFSRPLDSADGGIHQLPAATQSATNLWSWRDIKSVDILDEVTSAAYLEDFHELFSLDIQERPLAVPPSQLPDIDLYIRSENQAEIFLQKTICVRVNTALQMIFDKLSSNENLSLSTEFPAITQRPVYSPGLRSGSSSKNSAIIPDLWCHSFSDLMQKNPPFVVEDIKLDWKWNPFLGHSSDNDSLITYRTGLAQINFYMTVKNCIDRVVAFTQLKKQLEDSISYWECFKGTNLRRTMIANLMTVGQQLMGMAFISA